MASELLGNLTTQDVGRTDETYSDDSSAADGLGDGDTGSTGRVGEGPPTVPDYSLLEAIAVVNSSNVRNKVFDSDLPSRYYSFATELFDFLEGVESNGNSFLESNRIDDLPGLQDIPESEQENLGFCEPYRLVRATNRITTSPASPGDEDDIRDGEFHRSVLELDPVIMTGTVHRSRELAVPNPADSPQPDAPPSDPEIADLAIEEPTVGPKLSGVPVGTSSTQKRRPNAYESSYTSRRSFLLPSQEATSADWSDEGPPRDDTDYLLEDLPTIDEEIDDLRATLIEMNRNIYDNSSPLGALCWSVWEAWRAFAQQKYGYFFSESLRLFEEEVAKRTQDDVGANAEPNSVEDRIESGATGRTNETPEFPNDYSILDSLEAVAEGPIRARALDPSLPAAYLKLSQDFFAIIDDQRTLADPEGFDLESFTSDYLSDPGGVDMLDCGNYVIGNVDDETTAPTTTTAPDQPIPESPENGNDGPVTDSDSPPLDNTDDGDDPGSDPTTAAVTTTTTSTTTTTTTTVVPPPAPPPPEDEQEPEDSDNGDDDAEVDDPPPTDETETEPQAS